MTADAIRASLHQFFRDNAEGEGRRVKKYSNYLSLYEQTFARFLARRVRILEIGVQHGGSLAMWNQYFGGNVDIIGVDILPECKKFESGNVRIFIGDQSSDAFLATLSDNIGEVDIIVDDGSHIPSHQIRAFETLFYKNLASDGVYVVEDCHTSYWRDYGGGLRKKSSFIEYAKRLCDATNAWYARCTALPVTEATRWIESITFASSVVLVEKRPMVCPEVLISGREQIDLTNTFGRGKFRGLLDLLRRSAFIRRMVRRNQFLWRLMERLIRRPDRQNS